MNYYFQILESGISPESLPERERKLFSKAVEVDQLMASLKNKIDELRTEFVRTHGAHQMLVELLEEEAREQEPERIQLPIPEPMDFPEDDKK